MSGSSRLAGRTVLVTGSASGIGRAVALRLAREGAHLVVADLTERGETVHHDESTVAAIHASGGSAEYVRADVTNESDVISMIHAAQRHSGRLDVVVSNAGMFRGASILDTDGDSWDADLDLNLRSHFLVNKAAIRVMIEQDLDSEVRGRIVNVTSQLGMTAPPGNVTYPVSKAGLSHLTRQLAVDYARHGIMVNAVAPGRIITGYHPGEREYVESGAADAATQYSLERTPFSRLGRPEDVAGPVLFLASDDATFVSGHVLMVDGGWLAY